MKTVLGMVGVLAVSACGTDEALEAGDCPSTPTGVEIDPVAPFYSGLVTVTFESSISPGAVELQRYSASRGFWEQTYAPLAQKDDGSYLLQVRPQTYFAESDAEFKVRIRSTLQGCPPSGWAETDSVTLGDPIAGTTWIGEFGRTQVSAQIQASNAGIGTSFGPYRLAQTTPLRHSMTFGAGGVFSEQFDFTIDSPTVGDVYNGCRFVVAFEGTWFSDYDENAQIAIYDRRFKSLAGSMCASPPIADLQPSTSNRLDDFQLYASSIDYSRLLHTTPGKPRWMNYSSLQGSFSNILGMLSDSVGADTASLSGYVSVGSPTYEKQ